MLVCYHSSLSLPSLTSVRYRVQIKQADIPLPFFSYRVDPTKHPLIYSSYESAPPAVQAEILSEFVSAFVHHPHRLSHGRAGNIMMRKGVLPPYCKNGMEIGEIMQLVLDVRTRATTAADTIDENEDGGTNDEERRRQRKRRNQFSLHKPSELGTDRRGWTVSSGHSQKGFTMEMSLNAKGSQVCFLFPFVFSWNSQLIVPRLSRSVSLKKLNSDRIQFLLSFLPSLHIQSSFETRPSCETQSTTSLFITSRPSNAN